MLYYFFCTGLERFMTNRFACTIGLNSCVEMNSRYYRKPNNIFIKLLPDRFALMSGKESI